MGTISLRRSEALGLAGLALAWAGMWGAWIPHRTASLTQNAADLAGWADVLLDVRSGPLASVPDLLRLSLVLAALALAVQAGGVENLWLRWTIRLVAVLPALVLLPPYPFVLDLWRSETYGARFLIAAALPVGVTATILTDRLTPQVRRWMALGLAVTAVAAGLLAYQALQRPFEAHYASRLPPGWGVIAFAGGLAIGAAAQVIGLSGHARARNQACVRSKSTNGPEG